MFFNLWPAVNTGDCYVFVKEKDGDHSNILTDQELCVHVSDGTTSPSCSNYALKRTSVNLKNTSLER